MDHVAGNVSGPTLRFDRGGRSPRARVRRVSRAPVAAGAGAPKGKSWQILRSKSSTTILNPRFLSLTASYDAFLAISARPYPKALSDTGGGGGGGGGGWLDQTVPGNQNDGGNGKKTKRKDVMEQELETLGDSNASSSKCCVVM